MFEIKKRPQVIRDLIDLATYIAEDNLDVSDRLRCPHFQCQHTVKLKSLAQIAAFLHRKEERGIF
jgi:toxin ParE1/3/4